MPNTHSIIARPTNPTPATGRVECACGWTHQRQDEEGRSIFLCTTLAVWMTTEDTTTSE